MDTCIARRGFLVTVYVIIATMFYFLPELNQ
jgi:hypothetical protein